MYCTVKSKQDLTSEVGQTQRCCCQVSRCGCCSSHERWSESGTHCPASLLHSSHTGLSTMEKIREGFLPLKSETEDRKKLLPKSTSAQMKRTWGACWKPRGKCSTWLGLMRSQLALTTLHDNFLCEEEKNKSRRGQIQGSPTSKKCQTV